MTLKTRIFLDRICFFLQNTCDVATGRSRDKEWGPFCAFLEVRTCTCSEWHPPETWTSSPPVSGKPRSSSGRQGTAACHPLGSSPSSLVVSPPPPFSNLCPTTVKFETYCKRIGGLYNFVQRAEARKLASSESLAVLCRIMARLEKERRKQNCHFSPTKLSSSSDLHTKIIVVDFICFLKKNFSANLDLKLPKKMVFWTASPI